MFDVPPVPLQQQQQPTTPPMTAIIITMRLVSPIYSSQFHGQGSSAVSAGVIVGSTGRGLSGTFW